jgi:nucleoside 2-deoxyribosyltransferase
MKIYFAGSIRGGREDKELYLDVIKLLQEYGEVLTEHIGNAELTEAGEEMTDEDIYDRDMAWISLSDVVVAEVTSPSLGVGYEIGKAEDLDKPVICIYRQEPDRSLSAMIAGSPLTTVRKYENLEDLKVIFKELLSGADFEEVLKEPV